MRRTAATATRERSLPTPRGAGRWQARSSRTAGSSGSDGGARLAAVVVADACEENDEFGRADGVDGVGARNSRRTKTAAVGWVRGLFIVDGSAGCWLREYWGPAAVRGARPALALMARSVANGACCFQRAQEGQDDKTWRGLFNGWAAAGRARLSLPEFHRASLGLDSCLR